MSEGRSIYSHIRDLRFVRSMNDFRIFIDKSFYKLWLIIPLFLKTRKKPLSLQIELTNYCNLRCISCPRDSMKREKGYIEFALYKKIIDDAVSIGIKRVYLYLHGESFLHPQVIDIIKYTKQNKIGIHIATNGSYFTNGMISKILQTGLNSSDYITFSILGTSKDIHENIMKGAKHDEIVENISNLVTSRECLKANGPIIEAIFYSMPENEHERDLFVNEWKGKVDNVRVLSNISMKFANRSELNTSIRRKKCTKFFERMTIHLNGNVSVCYQDINASYIMGNLKNQSILDVWNSGKLVNFRKLQWANLLDEIPICATCDY